MATGSRNPRRHWRCGRGRSFGVGRHSYIDKHDIFARIHNFPYIWEHFEGLSFGRVMNGHASGYRSDDFRVSHMSESPNVNQIGRTRWIIIIFIVWVLLLPFCRYAVFVERENNSGTLFIIVIVDNFFKLLDCARRETWHPRSLFGNFYNYQSSQFLGFQKRSSQIEALILQASYHLTYVLSYTITISCNGKGS